MTAFLAALAVFLALHALPAATGLRDAAVARLGRGVYVGLYSLVSLASLAWLIRAAGDAPYIALWEPGAATAWAAVCGSALGALLIAAGAFRPNPLSVSFAGGAADPGRPGVLALTAHPVLWGFALWSGGHAVANGDVVSLILFGGFAVFSVVGMRGLERRAARRSPPELLSAAAAQRAGPLAERLRRALDARLGLELLAGLGLFAALLALHPWLIGVDPIAALGLG